jgi:hypothetical protein
MITILMFFAKFCCSFIHFTRQSYKMLPMWTTTNYVGHFKPGRRTCIVLELVCSLSKEMEGTNGGFGKLFISQKNVLCKPINGGRGVLLCERISWSLAPDISPVSHLGWTWNSNDVHVSLVSECMDNSGTDACTLPKDCNTIKQH